MRTIEFDTSQMTDVFREHPEFASALLRVTSLKQRATSVPTGCNRVANIAIPFVIASVRGSASVMAQLQGTDLDASAALTGSK
jgi:hypothetical protein